MDFLVNANTLRKPQQGTAPHSKPQTPPLPRYLTAHTADLITSQVV